MIFQEIRTIIDSEGDQSALLNELVNEFREHRNVSEVFELLNSNCDDLIRIGAWILTEIPFAEYHDNAIDNRLYELTQHSNAAIRLHSLNALFPFLAAGDQRTRDLIVRMRDDDNEGIRMTAKAAASKLGITFNEN